MSASPFHPQGFGQHGESKRQIDVNKSGFAPAMGRKNHLGTRIPFYALPMDCQNLVLRDYRNIWNLPRTEETLPIKLHPSRFSDMSPKMASIVGYIIGEKWVTPQVSGLIVTSDNFVMASVEGSFHDYFIGDYSDLTRNWTNLTKVAGLLPDELALAGRLFNEKVKHS
jgi:hypothetical protein